MEVADSFLVSEGLSLAPELHRARFIASAAERGFDDQPQLDEFWRAAIALIPKVGEWFPRFELIQLGDARRLQFRMRPAPVRMRRAAIWTYSGADPRRDPRIKGQIGRAHV